FVMLIGHRFNTQYYNSVLPRDWKIEYSSDHIKRIQNFWGIKDNQLKLNTQKRQEIKKEKIDLFNFMERL
ncbi:MAG: hypothetical protein ACFFA3_17760, partial [Promethearchaeota archaeon]